MRRRHRLLSAMLLVTALSATVGCLNLGGKTTYVSENPETNERLTLLETRVGVLERAVLGNPAPVGAPLPNPGSSLSVGAGPPAER